MCKTNNILAASVCAALLLMAVALSGCGAENIAGAAVGGVLNVPVKGESVGGVQIYDTQQAGKRCDPPSSVYPHWVCGP